MASLKNTGAAARNKQQGQQGNNGSTPLNGQPQDGQTLARPVPVSAQQRNPRLGQQQPPQQSTAVPPQQPPQQLVKDRPAQNRPQPIIKEQYSTVWLNGDPSKQKETGMRSPTFYTQDQVLNGQAAWSDMQVSDRQKILSDPNFYKNNNITKYDPAIQQQILADPNFDWSKLPKWQQAFYSLSSNPAAMGAAQGLVMGAGNPGGAAVGALMGWGAAKSGYDQNKEFWNQSNAVAGAFGLMNWAAEQAEKGIGTGAQIANYAADPNKQVSDLFQNFDATWNAGGNFFETIAPAFQQALDPRNHSVGENALAVAVLPMYVTAKVGDIILNPEKYKGNELYLGAANPIPLDESWIKRIENARKEIEGGRNYREVMTEIQTGIMAQLGDMAGQGIADPLNFVGKAEAKVGEVTAKLSGDKIAEAAFSQAEGFSDARQRIQNLIANPAEALKIDPNYKVSELGWISKNLSGLTKDLQVKGGLLESAGGLLDYKKPKKSLTGFIESLTSLTPEARARTGQDLLVRNLGSIMASYFNGNDVTGFSQWWKSFSNGDMTQSAELSRTMAQSPEFYTVLPAAKGYDIDGRLAVWETSEPARMAVSRIADVLGENPMTFIEDVVRRGTGVEDFARIQEKLKAAGTPEAKSLLADIQAGRFTEANLTDAVNTFADGSVPFHPGQWMAETLDAIKSHYDNWAVDHFKLDEESRKTLFRVTAVMKSAQSILLLGANPGYMISNVLPTMVTRAAHGVYGYMTPAALDTFFSRMGFSLEEGFAPSRLEEGVGPGGLIDQTRQTGDAIREATLGKGKLTDIQRALGKIGSAMPFNKLSRLLEGYEGKMAYAIGIKKMWGESWRRGTGFREIPPALLTELTRTVGKSAADILYSQIEAGMTKQEIQSIVAGRSADIQSRSLINTAAQELNIPASKAASMLEQMGVLDQLDANLKGAYSEGRIRAAFENARRTAQVEIDQQASRDAIARVEHISNRIQTEGYKAITDITIDMESKGNELWLKHLERMGELADVIDKIDNPDTRRRMYAIKYAESNAEHVRFSAERGSTYLGILKAVGLDSGESGRGLLANLADTDRVNDNAYRTTRDLRDQHFKKWNNDDWSNPRRQVEYNSMEAQIDKVWKDATKAEARNLKKFGELMADQYKQLFGTEAGEAAAQAWEQISAFRKEMTDRRDSFRESQKQAQAAGVPRVQRQLAAKEFWGKTYNYMVIEMGRIKQEAISNLDRIARNGNGGNPAAAVDPNNPSGGGGGFVNPEMEALRQAAQERARIEKEKINAVWEIAQQYSKKQPNNSSNFERGYFGDEQHLLRTLRKEEYGGDPSITNLKDATEKLTPEQIKNIFEKREGVKVEDQAAFEAEQLKRFTEATQNAELRAKNKKVAENVQLLQNIKKRGGIDIESWMRFGDKPEGYQPGVFSRNGKNRWSLDQMARLLADDGYPIDVNNPADIGGINQLVDLIGRARAGEEIFPVGHEFIIDAEVSKAQAAYLENLASEQTFDGDQWLIETLTASEGSDRIALDNLLDNLPEEMLDQNITAQETYREYAERISKDLDEKIARDSESMAIAEGQVRSEAAVQKQQATAETAMTRQLFREKLQDAFGLNEDMTDTVMSLTDARAESWAALGNGSADEWYATRIADVVKDGDNVDLAQAQDVTYSVEKTGYPDGSYHVRGSDGNLYNIKGGKIEPKTDGALPRRFKSFEDATAALAKAGYETGADGTPTPRNAKGGVQFLDDGKAIIRAFEKADVSTVVHEIGHIFRRDLKGTDLAIIENWAEVKNGQWTREAEEKFARGFEKYLADGSAPTPKLKVVFEKFKTWMGNIYRAITGSPIDIELNAAVKEVFDRLLVGNERVKQVDVGDMLTQLGYDPKTYYLNESGRIVRRPELNIRVDQTARTQAADEIIGNMQEKLNALKRGEPVRVGQTVDPATPTPPKNTSTWKMNYEEYKASLLQEQKDFATRRIEQIKRGEFRDNLHIDEAKELARMEAMLSRNTVSYEMFGDSRESYRKAIEKALIDERPVPDEIKQAYYAMGKEGNLSGAEYRNLQQAGRGQVNELFQIETNYARNMDYPTRIPDTETFKNAIGDFNVNPEFGGNILFQEADPRMPMGGYEEAAGWLPQSEVMNEGWSSEVQPLLDKMQEAATRQLSEPKLDGAYKDMTPEGQRMLQQYLNGVTQDMASTKMAAQRWGAQKRDNAMLNYNERYGFDKMLDVVYPYQFFYTRSMMTWAARALDKPAWLSNYARLRKQQDRYENNLPERLRGKMRIDAPWLPDWMGDGLYIDPLSVLFTPHNFLRPFEQMTKDKNMQVIEAERILQEWAADGTVSQDQIQEAAQTRGGSTWERALAEAKIRREAEISNPMDFISTMFGPAWYLTTPAKLLNIGKDGPETLTELPLTRTARAIDTVTNNTWAEPIGNVLGLLAKPEEAFREKNNLPQFGEYGDYYTDRNIANMVVEGLITTEEAQIAMMERKGDIFDAAVERTKMELAMRVPTAGFIYAALNEGVAAAAQASVPSLFGAGLLPQGELEYRGMKQEWNEAWKLRDAGDTEAINRFFEKNPEYEAYLAKGKEPEERLRSFLIGQIWDGYMELGDTNRKQATAEMGDLFKQSFLNSETRSYDTLDIEQLTQWAQMVNQRVPNVQQTAPAIANPRQINYYAPEVTQITDTFYQQRKRMYGDYYELEQGYYDLPKSERASYLVANPKLKQYWDWKDSYYKRYPDLVPIFKGQVFKRIDTSNWPLGLTDYVEAYAFAGEKLPNGAYKALEQVWINEGRPMDDFDTWVKSQVLPAIQYQAGAQMQP